MPGHGIAPASVAVPLGLPDVHARDRARNNESLNFTGALEDGIDIKVAYKSPRHTFFPNWRDPRKMEKDPFKNGSGRFCTWLVGRQSAPQIPRPG